MANVLLLGAGFSANWNAPLARDFFNWLLERDEVKSDAGLRDILWRYKDHGGFENALSEVQAAYLGGRTPANKGRLERFQQAINGIFADIDAGHAARASWDFNNEIGGRLVDFLVRFDAIFMLNEDLLFERFYLNHNVMLTAPGRWDGAILPGMRMIPNSDFPIDPGRSSWTPDPTNFTVPGRSQPCFKLHGSYRWREASGEQLMIMGGGKGAAIRSHSVLQWYQTEFRRYLTMGETRLMVVGYGFRDDHINEVIAGAASTGIKMFIVDPLGVDVADPTRDLPMRMPNPFQGIIESASQVPFTRTFADNVMERKRLERFLR
jgi:hypothetical protein